MNYTITLVQKRHSRIGVLDHFCGNRFKEKHNDKHVNIEKYIRLVEF